MSGPDGGNDRISIATFPEQSASPPDGPDADETKDASLITRYLSDQAVAIDGTSVLVHHPGWSDTGRARGGSQLESNVDETLTLSASSNEDDDTITLTRKKVKEGPQGTKLYLSLRLSEESAHFEMQSPLDQSASLRTRTVRLLAEVGTAGMTGPQLANELGYAENRSAVQRELRILRADGLVEADGKRGHERYFLAQAASDD